MGGLFNRPAFTRIIIYEDFFQIINDSGFTGFTWRNRLVSG
jgi:hypothetical protein